MSNFVQYGKIGLPIKYGTLPTATSALTGVLGQVGDTIYRCNGTNWEQVVFPTGNINITDTQSTDVTDYATAQVVDANLVASNIKKDVDILGITGTFEGGGGQWQPNADMVWAKGVCENDTQAGFTYKVLQMISDGWTYTDIVVPSGGAVKTSDGGYYTSNAQHIWDDTNARVSVVNPLQKLRWLIYYYTSETPTISLLTEVMYACFDGVKFGKIFSSKRMLEYFDIINNANLSSSVTNMESMFANCSSLQRIPLLDTSNVTNMQTMFYECSSLQSIPLLDTANVTTMQQMFASCYSLQTVPLLDTANVTTMLEMFRVAYSLQSIPQLNTGNVGNISSMFYTCRSLQAIPLLDMSRVTNISSIFSSCSNLGQIKMTNIKKSFNISASTKFLRANLLEIINNLYDLTGQTAQTLTIGATNLAKLTAEDIAIATSRNWSIA